MATNMTAARGSSSHRTALQRAEPSIRDRQATDLQDEEHIKALEGECAVHMEEITSEMVDACARSCFSPPPFGITVRAGELAWLWVPRILAESPHTPRETP
jgi:hypothetical protein